MNEQASKDAKLCYKHAVVDGKAIKQPVSEHQKKRIEKILPGLVERLRDKAYELGYAIGTHGSMARDIDLIVVPWTSKAIPAILLMRALMLEIEQHCGAAFFADGETDEYFQSGCPGLKAHGRLAWSIHVGGTYVDLSVMPRSQDYGKDEHWMPGIVIENHKTRFQALEACNATETT